MMLSELDDVFKTYFNMLSKDLNSLLSPVVDINDLQEFQNKMTEISCLHQMIFPASEHNIIFHHLMHFASHIQTSRRVTKALVNLCRGKG
jgi:hypothetical protein